MAKPTERPLKPGDVLADRYVVVALLGEGGMGVVYECKHMRLGTRVAIKTLLDDVADDPEVRHRFDREARAAAQLKSKHVTQVIDVDVMADGRPFMVMEYLDGYPLDVVIEAGERVDVAECANYILEACSGMAEAHALGIVHRDLKPPNLFCSTNDGEPRIKVLDFGISKVLLPGDKKRVTQTTMSFGTPTYMSPEQIQSAKNVDNRADIWSLGVILYELLVGDVPFGGDNPGAIIWSICSTKPRPPHELRGDLPKALSDVVMKALEKDREVRYQSVNELAEALLPFGTAGSWEPPDTSPPAHRKSHPTGRVATASSLPTVRADSSPNPPSHAPWTTDRRIALERTQAALLLGTIAVALAVGGAVGFVMLRDERSVSSETKSPATEEPASPSAVSPAAASAAHEEYVPPPPAPSAIASTQPRSAPPPKAVGPSSPTPTRAPEVRPLPAPPSPPPPKPPPPPPNNKNPILL